MKALADRGLQELMLGKLIDQDVGWCVRTSTTKRSPGRQQLPGRQLEICCAVNDSYISNWGWWCHMIRPRPILDAMLVNDY